MSRIGKKPIQLPQGVTATVDRNVLTVKGPKGELTRVVHPAVSVAISDEGICFAVQNQEEKTERALWGTFGAHAKNMVVGVSQGFSKQLEVNGVGYRVALQGTDLKLDLGFSHPVLFPVPTGVSAKVEKNVITLESANKELLGMTAANIRAIKKPEPYKGKGIKYMTETIRRKAGKAAKAK